MYLLTLGRTRGGWMPPPRKVFSKFWKKHLTYNTETFRSCSFILCRNFDMSTMCPWYMTLPWQRHKYMQVLPKIVIFNIFLDFFQFFKTEAQDLFIFTFHKHFPLFCDFLRKCWNPRWRIQDGGSYDVTWRHMTSQPIKIMSSCRVSEGLSCQSKIISLRLNITKTPGRGSIHPPPPLYDDGGMSLLVRPRVKSR